MRRLASGFATLWIILFVPSLILWALIVRASEAGMGRFHATWHWFEDKLAFPLALSPITDRAWYWLDHGTYLGVTVGFLLLIAVWSTMFTLPLVLVSGWWRWIGDRIAGNREAATFAYADDYATTVIPIPGRISSSPIAGLYVLTIPLGLLMAGLKGIFGSPADPVASFLRPVFGTFVIVFLSVVGFFAFLFGTSSYFERLDVLDLVFYDIWYGYLDVLKIPHIFHGRWLEAANTINRTTQTTSFHDWPLYMGSWYEHEEFRTLVWITSMRHAVGAAAVMAIWQTLRRVF